MQLTYYKVNNYYLFLQRLKSILFNNTNKKKKDQTDTEAIATMDLASCTSLNRNSDVAPKKMAECAFSVDIKEHKEIRTYYLSAHSEGEKKQWLDAMVASKKYFSTLTAVHTAPSKGVSASGTSSVEKDLASARAEVKRLKDENAKLKKELDQKGGGDEEHEDLILQLEELEEKYAVEKKKREALEKAAKGAPGTPRKGTQTTDESELEALRDEYEEKIRFMETQHAKELQAAKGGGGGKKNKKGGSNSDDGFDVPDFDDEDNEDDWGKKSPRQRQRTSEAELRKENAALKKQLEEKGSKSPRGTQQPDPRVADLEEEIAELNEVIERLTHEVAELQLDKQEWEASRAIGEENETLKTQIEELEKALDELEEEQKSKQRVITDLQAKLKGGERSGGREEELLKKLDVMDGVLMDLEQELDAAKQEVERLKTENKQLKAKGTGGGGGLDAAALEEENAQLAEELEAARADAAKYKQKLDLLRVEYKKLSMQKK